MNARTIAKSPADAKHKIVIRPLSNAKPVFVPAIKSESAKLIGGPANRARLKAQSEQVSVTSLGDEARTPTYP
jgi:hypothetical protein